MLLRVTTLRSNTDGISIHEPLYIVACRLLPENVNSPFLACLRWRLCGLPQLEKTTKEVLVVERWTLCITTAMGSI